jgi:hypothetical protein
MIGINPLEILWNMIIQVGAWTAALYSTVFTEWFEIPGIASFSIWNMIVNPMTFILLLVAIVVKKVVPVL